MNSRRWCCAVLLIAVVTGCSSSGSEKTEDLRSLAQKLEAEQTEVSPGEVSSKLGTEVFPIAKYMSVGGGHEGSKYALHFGGPSTASLKEIADFHTSKLDGELIRVDDGKKFHIEVKNAQGRIVFIRFFTNPDGAYITYLLGQAQ